MKTDRALGAMNGCATCPSGTNCCTRHLQSRIGSAFIFEREIADMEAFTGRRRISFVEMPRRGQQVLKTVGSGCIFYEDGRCQVYSVRPFDCRVFPFDIVTGDDDGFTWIVYDRICNAGTRHAEAFEAIKGLLCSLKPSHGELTSYTRKKALNRDKSSFLVLETVDRSCICD